MGSIHMRHLEGFIVFDNAMVFEELQGSFQSEGFMGSNAVINVFPFDNLFVQFRDDPRAVIDFVELLGMGSI